MVHSCRFARARGLFAIDPAPEPGPGRDALPVPPGGRSGPLRQARRGRRPEINPCPKFPDSRYSHIPRNTIQPDFNPR
ncbi:hypothetical protein DF021_25040 [Burkholderia stagnalis]|uniref:Uncharacterized protein n=1 Tax=Burkholderia stagnalis TaxID=1503054 RepID=A0ABX9YGU7_9BURK|nr:hypothetical protein DF158_27120 [Burkholderia stagnalis]RQQ63257.1 hypothetical protein DF137_26450 [Burkholderia stagnalis]RQQ64152.1 hypothetical protein DF139_26005 [Burkholderia stagnalis]RQQ77085.1 hypothetical protein DF138_26055 [Burkholderia stagnalis]RQQ83957.1 hypothetical protein DF134_27295 [Burkholderia stagnalis]